MNTRKKRNQEVLAGSDVASVGVQLDRLRIRCHRSARAHYIAAHRAKRLHYLLGVPAVACSALAGTAIFASLSQSSEIEFKIATGSVAILAAVLTTLQTFLAYSERSEKHRLAASEYNGLKRQLDLACLEDSAGDETTTAAKQTLRSLISEVNALELRVPSVPDRLYNRARDEEARDLEGI